MSDKGSSILDTGKKTRQSFTFIILSESFKTGFIGVKITGVCLESYLLNVNMENS